MLLTLIVFLIILSLLVLVHELGHFLAAKKFGIKVEEFGFGLPPRILGVNYKGTIYSINWLPIGGFVKLYGEDEEETSLTSDGGRPILSKVEGEAMTPPRWTNRAFFAKPKLVRMAVLLAGVTMNFLLAVVVISYIFSQGVFVPTEKVFIREVASGSPAELAGFKVNDEVLVVAGQKITKTEQFVEITKKNVGQEISVEVLRQADNPCAKEQKVLGAYPGLKISCHGENVVVFVTPRASPPKGEGPIGVAISNLEERKYPWYQAPFLGTIEAFKLSGLMVVELEKILVKLITFQPVGEEVAGPLGIAQATGEAVKFGWIAVLQLLGLLSLNLAVVNILPFPALDGGRLLFVGIEAITGKKVKPRWERWAHQIGMGILLGLIVLVTINDLLRIFKH